MKKCGKSQKSGKSGESTIDKVVLVGTYKKGQLEWIGKSGIYNYPIKDDDKMPPEAFGKIVELWLYLGKKGKRTVKTASFRGIMSREEFLAEFPDYPKGKGKPHSDRYAVFTVKDKAEDRYSKLREQALPEDMGVIVRFDDFKARTPAISKAIKAYQDGGEFGNLLDYLPSEISALPRKQLRVFESWVQMDFWALLNPGVSMHCSIPKEIRDRKMTIIDLFAGCGGMSLGFEFSGFSPVLAVEKDEWASETYAYNRRNVNVVTGDITKIQHPRQQYNKIGDVFGIIGGPPCQGFSLSGDRDPKDPRNSLFMDYMRFVKDFNPSFFVMENVPGILSSVTKSGAPVKDVIVSVARELGYNVKIIQLDASHYGVPQSRLRVFFVGIRKDYPFDADRLMPIKSTEKNPITIRQAISDLPSINACEGSENMPYEVAADNEYQSWCRDGSDMVHNHVAMRHTQRLVDRFRVIKYGESAADVPREHMQRKRGDASVISGKVYSQNNMRPFPDRPSPTVPASFQSNFVHPFRDRNYTAREGARLQSFPDRYVFRGRRTTMSWEKNLSQYQQIGNAVPPLLAKALGDMIKSYFSDIENIKDKS